MAFRVSKSIVSHPDQHDQLGTKSITEIFKTHTPYGDKLYFDGETWSYKSGDIVNFYKTREKREAEKVEEYVPVVSMAHTEPTVVHSVAPTLQEEDTVKRRRSRKFLTGKFPV